MTALGTDMKETSLRPGLWWLLPLLVGCGEPAPAAIGGPATPPPTSNPVPPATSPRREDEYADDLGAAHERELLSRYPGGAQLVGWGGFTAESELESFVETAQELVGDGVLDGLEARWVGTGQHSEDPGVLAVALGARRYRWALGKEVDLHTALEAFSVALQDAGDGRWLATEGVDSELSAAWVAEPELRSRDFSSRALAGGGVEGVVDTWGDVTTWSAVQIGADELFFVPHGADASERLAWLVLVRMAESDDETIGGPDDVQEAVAMVVDGLVTELWEEGRVDWPGFGRLEVVDPETGEPLGATVEAELETPARLVFVPSEELLAGLASDGAITVEEPEEIGALEEPELAAQVLSALLGAVRDGLCLSLEGLGTWRWEPEGGGLVFDGVPWT